MRYRVNEKFKRRRKMAAPLYDWLSAMIVALTLLAFLFTFLFRVVGVDGTSMVPTLKNEDRLLLTNLGSDYTVGEIVVVDRYTQEPLIKRVIAVAGDVIDIDGEGTVTVNGVELYEPYIQGETVLRDFSGPLTVPEGYIFVMGDNRSVSKDSRSASVGLISLKDVVGRAILRIWPLSSLGKVSADGAERSLEERK